MVAKMKRAISLGPIPPPLPSRVPVELKMHIDLGPLVISASQMSTALQEMGERLRRAEEDMYAEMMKGFTHGHRS